jgi:uncharacterized protein YbaR (Trm112 family)
MHLLLTDRMACPRCGPAFGLILRADALEERRVLQGGLGCPNCREVYPVTDGAGDLRPPPRPAVEREVLPEPDTEQVDVAQALLGLAEGPGEIALVGRAARFGRGLASRIPGLEVVALPPAALEWDEVDGLTRMVTGVRLPFGDRVFRGVLLEGPGARARLRDAARVLARGHRVVVLDAPEGTAPMLMASGLTVNLDQDGVVVASR